MLKLQPPVMNSERGASTVRAAPPIAGARLRKLSPPIAAATRSYPVGQTTLAVGDTSRANGAAARLLMPSVVEIANLSGTDRCRMYEIYEAHYEATSWKRFAADLDEKFCTVLVRDAGGEIQGFSTIAIFETSVHGVRRRAMYSGDTIIDRAYWGSQHLPFTWIRLAGHIKALAPDIPLHWFVIVKGHRTFRLLSAFSDVFYPHWAYETPRAVQEVMDHLGTALFPGAYRADLGIIQFPESHGHLVPELAQIPPAIARRADVAFFLKRNPRYAGGDELLCLTELCAENLRPIARKHFLEGYRR